MIETEQIEAITKFRLARHLPGLPPYFTTCYHVDGLMIDSGCAHATRDLLRQLRRTGLRPHTVVNSHRHEDHIGGNAALQRHFGARVLGHPLSLPVLRRPAVLQPMQIYRRVMWGVPEASHGAPLTEGDEVRTTRYRFQVLHTPGHSVDHLALYEPHEGWLFTGDTYVGGQDRGLRWDSEVWQIIASLRRLQQLRPRLLLPGCASVQRDPGPALQAKVTQLEQLGQRVLQLQAQGLDVAQITRALLGRERLFFRLTQGDFNGANLVRSFLRDAATDATPRSP